MTVSKANALLLAVAIPQSGKNNAFPAPRFEACLVGIRSRLIALTLILCSVMMSAVSAGVVTYTSKSAFDAATSSQALDTFDDLNPGSRNSPLNRTAGSYTYDATSTNNYFYVVNIGGDKRLSAFASGDRITFALSAGAPRAIGGYFYVDTVFSPYGTLKASINGGANLLTSAGPGAASYTNFFGWVSDSSITTLEFYIDGAAPQEFATVNNLVFAQKVSPPSGAVPEPTSLAIFGLGSFAFAFSRRRKT